MNIFQKAAGWIRGMFVSDKSIQEIYNVNLAISPFMRGKQQEWREIASGSAKWNKDDVVSMRLANLISQEIASMAAYGSKSNINGGKVKGEDGKNVAATNPRAEWLDESYQAFFDNVSANNLQNAVIALCNGGEIILKLAQDNGSVSVSVCETDFYWVLGYDSRGNLIDVVFGATASKDKYVYKLLERNTFDKQTRTQTVSYKAFRTEQKDTVWNPESLGEPANLAEIPEWAGLADYTIQNIDRPLFVHIKMPLYEQIERPQRQGMPVWSKAVDALEETDTHAARMRREMKDTELALVINADKYRSVGGTPAKFGEHGEPKQPAKAGKMELPEGDGRKFIAINGGINDVFAVDTFNPTPRVAEYLTYMNTMERRVERLSNLSYGVISDNNEQTKTAEEFKKSHRKTITLVGTIQTLVFEPALKHLAESINVLADIMGIPYGEYEVAFDWDDSYATDRTAEANERLKWQAAGVIPVQQNIAWWNDVDVDSETVKKIMQMVREERSEMQDEYGGI